MIKDLIKVAAGLDAAGFKKEADKIDAMISKLAHAGWPRPSMYHGKFFADEKMASNIHPSYRGSNGGMINWKYSPEGNGMVDLYASHPYEEDAPQYLQSMSEEELKGYI